MSAVSVFHLRDYDTKVKLAGMTGEEDTQHLLVGCVFARQFWFQFLQHVGLAALAPQPTDSSFKDWWEKVELLVNGDMRADLNSLIILGGWTIWRHRNDCVVIGASPSIATALILARDEAQLWSMAGAKGFCGQVLPLPLQPMDDK
uniref:Uncharacterized protein n=1 Tax=Setaria viridis TaxID=4556 RepID=A0A4V6D6D8_SETVI|nr:hypothetical protein SEVIR_5G136400v2 [Setaria viridis]